MLHNRLLAQHTVYVAFREFGALIVGELNRQQAFVNHQVDVAPTGTEEQQADRAYAVHLAAGRAEQLSFLVVENTCNFSASTTTTSCSATGTLPTRGASRQLEQG